MGQRRVDIINKNYTQIAFIFHILENVFLYSFSRRFLYHSWPYSCFFSFSSSIKISILLTSILALFLFFFWKILVSFTRFYLKLLFVFLVIVSCHFLYIVKNYKKVFLLVLLFFLIFFIWIFFIKILFIRSSFIRIFFMRILSIRIRRNFYIINKILRNLFFSLTTYLHSSKNTWV